MSFLKSYTDYAGRLTDAPPLFHTWVGISLLATALGNQCWAWEWGRRLCPNLWIVLLADSGILRKTTALGIGQGVLMESLPYLVWPSEWSFEALIQTMAQKPDGVLIVREFKRFNAALMRDYAGGSKELLVDAYDNPELDSRRTKQDGNTDFRFPAPNLLAATTRDWFEASLQKEDVGGGFLSRMFIVPATERGEWKGIGATRSDADRLQKEDLACYLEKARHGMQGEIDASQIEGPFNEWLRQYEDSWAYCLNGEMTGTISRSGANALKLAMIFQADREPSTTLTLDAFERAREMVELANKQMADLLADGLGLSPDAKERKKVAAVIQRAGEIERSALLQATNVSADALARHVKTLVEAQQIECGQRKLASGAGRPAVTYRWTNGARP